MKEIFIGDKSKFGIRYIPGYRYKIENSNDYHEFANIHLVLAGQIIGDPDEICIVRTWTHSLRRLKNRLTDNFEAFSNPEFIKRTDKEIFELINKANQLKEEFNPEYLYLPQLDNTIWSTCNISLDETTDAWLLRVIRDNEYLKFLWKGWRSPCPKERLNKLFSIQVGKNFAIQTMATFLERIENDLFSYPVKG